MNSFSQIIFESQKTDTAIKSAIMKKIALNIKSFEKGKIEAESFGGKFLEEVLIASLESGREIFKKLLKENKITVSIESFENSESSDASFIKKTVEELDGSFYVFDPTIKRDNGRKELPRNEQSEIIVKYLEDIFDFYSYRKYNILVNKFVEHITTKFDRLEKGIPELGMRRK